MCVQNIKSNRRRLFLGYLNNCKEDIIYPPYEVSIKKHFITVNGLKGKQISVSRNKFKVILDDKFYDDEKEFLDVLYDLIYQYNSNDIKSIKSQSDVDFFAIKECSFSENISNTNGISLIPLMLSNKRILNKASFVNILDNKLYIKEGNYNFNLSLNLSLVENGKMTSFKVVLYRDGNELCSSFSSIITGFSNNKFCSIQLSNPNINIPKRSNLDVIIYRVSGEKGIFKTTGQSNNIFIF